MFNLFKPFDMLTINSNGIVAYNPLINYDWSTTTASGLRYLKDVGITPTYNASMYFGRGAYLNGVDQTITVPINTTIQTALKRVNGIVTINETSQTLTNYVISGLGVHKDYYLFTRLLTTAEKDSYTNTPEAFYAMAQADNTCVLNMPMCETDGYARNMKSYSEGSELINPANFIPFNTNDTVKVNGTTITITTRTDYWGYCPIDVDTSNGSYVYYSYEVVSSTGGSRYARFTTSESPNGAPIGQALPNTIGVHKGVTYVPSDIGNIAFGNSPTNTLVIKDVSVKKLSGVYPIINYTTSVRDNAKNLQYGLQTCKFVRNNLGVIQSASNYLECNGTGYAIIPSHTDTVNIKMTVNPTSLSGNLLSGGATKTLTGLTLNIDNDVVISNVTPTGAITLASGFSGTIKTYTEELV